MLAVEIYKSEICDFLALVRRQFAQQIGRAGNGWSAVRDRKMGYKLFGVIIAIAGAVIVIHTVPVFVWYIALAVLVLIFAFLMLNT